MTPTERAMWNRACETLGMPDEPGPPYPETLDRPSCAEQATDYTAGPEPGSASLACVGLLGFLACVGACISFALLTSKPLETLACVVAVYLFCAWASGGEK